jgi:hypothetical protein
MLQSFFDRLSAPPLVNTKDYSLFVLITFGIGCYMWAMVYGVVIYDIIKKKRVDTPVGAVCACFAWEFWWGLFYRTDMGSILQWSYAIWFLMDCFILYAAFRYGAAQATTDSERKYHIPRMIVMLATWMVIMGYFIPAYDDRIGAYTGWIINTVLSIAFCVQKLKQPTFGTNRFVAISKFMATALCTTVCFTYFYENKTLISLCFIFASFDLMYIYLVFTGPKTDNATVVPAGVATTS